MLPPSLPMMPPRCCCLLRSLPPRRALAVLRPQQQLSLFSTAQQPQHVTALAFASLVHKCGLSVETLHRLDAAAQAVRMRDGSDVFPIAVALSGGADSMALTLLLREHLQRQQIRTPLLAITVDHRLRAESAQEATDVGQCVSKRWGVTHVVAQCEWSDEPLETAKAGVGNRPAKPRGSKLQEEARRYRYSLLREVCREKHVKYLFVAHNLGDQLETVLFRLGRASGINGLAGIASVSTLHSHSTSGGDGDGEESSIRADDAESDLTEDSDADTSVRLVRPLLSVPKAQLKETCRQFEQEWVEDPSNEKLLFDRIRIRKELERLESERGPELLQLFSRFQQSAARAKTDFALAERSAFQKYAIKRGSGLIVLRTTFLDDEHMFEELRFRLVSESVLVIGNKDTPPRLASVSRVVRELPQLESGKSLTLGGCRITKKNKGQELHFQPER